MKTKIVDSAASGIQPNFVTCFILCSSWSTLKTRQEEGTTYRCDSDKLTSLILGVELDPGTDAAVKLTLKNHTESTLINVQMLRMDISDFHQE